MVVLLLMFFTFLCCLPCKILSLNFDIWILFDVTVKKSSDNDTQFVDAGVDQAEFKDLLLFIFKELEVATMNFSEINKLGEGGFGPVYKVTILVLIEHLVRVVG